MSCGRRKDVRARDVAEAPDTDRYAIGRKGAPPRDYIKGLTTACAIWLSAGVGVACGSGHGLVAATATFLTILIMVSHRVFMPLDEYCRGL